MKTGKKKGKDKKATRMQVSNPPECGQAIGILFEPLLHKMQKTTHGHHPEYRDLHASLFVVLAENDIFLPRGNPRRRNHTQETLPFLLKRS